MKIAFWSPFSFSGRKSTNLLLMALMAAGEGKEQLVLHVNAKESGPEHYLLSGRNREHLLQNGEFGLGFLEQMLRCERFDKSLVVNSAYSFAGGRVHVLPAGNVNGNGISVNELACAIAKRAEKVFQNVFLEVPSGCQNSSLEICRNADLVVVNISQSLRDIQSLDRIPPFSREFYLIGAYEKKCSYTMHGSGKHAEESVFVRNMTELRRDVLNECTKRSQTEYLFSGLGLVSAAPAAFFPVVRSWGMKNMPELADFYRGMAGKIVVLLLFLCTIGSYFLMRLLRRSNGALYHRPEFLEHFLNLSFFENLEKRAAGGAFERFGRKQLKRAGMEKNGMEYWFLAGVAGIVLGFVYVLVLWDISFPVLFFGAFVSFVLGVLGTMAIYRYLSYLRGLGITGEVLGLQSIILLLFEAPNMTIGKLLETMGEYAEIFRRDLLFCADRYAAEESEALAMLTEESLPQEFRRMTKKLQISERLGLVPAFAELSADRQYFREQQRIDTEQQLHKRVANAQVLAFLPMFFLLFAYLIFPFLAASLGQMSEIFGEMNQMRAF